MEPQEQDQEQQQDFDDFESIREVYERLLKVTSDEMEVAKYLLPFQQFVVDEIIYQITNMNAQIKSAIKKTTGASSQLEFHIEQHQIELERFSYVLNSYLRIRLKKIETNAPYLIKLLKTDRPRADKYLSPLEAKYLDRYNDSIDSYMRDVVLKDMPENMQRFRLADMVSKQEEEAKVNYAFVLAANETIIQDGDSVVTLRPDQSRILPISTILQQFENNSHDLQLI